MCDHCGCGQPADSVTYRKPGHHHDHHDHDHHDHDHHHHDHHHHGHHDHDHQAPTGSREVAVEQDILQLNNLLAQRNRGWFEAKEILALNLVSSPGSGKTTLLECTISGLQNDPAVAVIEGDQQTLRDAERIAATGAPVLQINTGHGCHLNAEMIHKACHELNPVHGSILMIENVGNLVCPALFDLGEAAKIVIISVTEGDDKPMKYPTMFAVSSLCLINKIDLLPYVNFNVQACKEAALKVNPSLEFIEISATQGDGIQAWLKWLRNYKESHPADPPQSH
ncbi:MAG: hydrogenase nickel incorporation protein HypB [Candidatus Eisenbacteria bacterium]|uniref:Hydrogenase nickel incorporation protein HypB n=1 Tax=Eiseniibacteriota bacterium TaxID=2212470 RepID=A0A948RZK3_UNCEI|nr:hydrogenase nickel incorporation protein HypB [Candidatus Eisenbacteria bacterium]MBU1947401.1 hydrogenase nickel incorporation protein HypB [Candidatus Eisenbacteria bacterium]MBU2692082.1 hydrogenase nickel incorporation protein HypB [Candidatus Eisenbacteria bacterium]